jgi:endoglucanase
MRRLFTKAVVLMTLMSMLLLLGGVQGFAMDNSLSTVPNPKINTFKAIDPVTAASQMTPGWNLGNTMDPPSGEGGWGHFAMESTFDDLVQKGYKSVRIPITWIYATGDAPNYKINPNFLDRIETIIDWALERDLYVMINMHHDSWFWVSSLKVDPVTGVYVSNFEENRKKFDRIWQQVAERFKNKNEKLIFEALNEPDVGDVKNLGSKPSNPDSPETKAYLSENELNLLMSDFLKVVRDTGGNNTKRICVISHQWNNSIEVAKRMYIPDDKYLMTTFHFYGPWHFINNWWNKTTWGWEVAKDYQEMEADMKVMYEKFVQKGIPVLVGEVAAFNAAELHQRDYWYNYVGYMMYKFGYIPFLWDAGNNLDREYHKWKAESNIDYFNSASLGVRNSFIKFQDNYVQVNQPAEIVIMADYNGNQVEEVTNGSTKLVSGVDYIADYNNSTFTVSKDYVAKVLKKDQLGINATLTVKFTSGLDQTLNMIQYDQPVLAMDKATFPIGAYEDLKIPVQYNGNKLATVKGVLKSNGQPIEDSWALGYMKGGDFSSDANHLILSQWFIKKLKPDTDYVFTFEYWANNQKVTNTFELHTVLGESPRNFSNKVIVDKKKLQVGETAHISGVIQSVDGAAMSGATAELQVLDNGIPVVSKKPNGISIEPNQSVTVEAEFTPVKPGKYIVSFVAYKDIMDASFVWNQYAAEIIVIDPAVEPPHQPLPTGQLPSEVIANGSHGIYSFRDTAAVVDSSENVAVVTISADDLKKARTSIKQLDGEKKYIKIPFKAVEGVDGYAVELPSSALSQMPDTQFIVETPRQEVILSGTMMKSKELAGAATVRFTIKNVQAKVSAGIAEQIGDRAVVEFSFKADGKVLEWHDASQPMHISMAYDIKNLDLYHADSIAVYQLGEGGKVKKAKEDQLNLFRGSVTFTAANNGIYAIVNTDGITE